MGRVEVEAGKQNARVTQKTEIQDGQLRRERAGTRARQGETYGRKQTRRQEYKKKYDRDSSSSSGNSGSNNSKTRFRPLLKVELDETLPRDLPCPRAFFLKCFCSRMCVGSISTFF